MALRSRFDLRAVQSALAAAQVDAWLFYDFRGSDPIARKILGLDPTHMGTRRWLYCLPARGAPRKLVHAIEAGALDALPGEATVYLTHASLQEGLESLLAGHRRVAMQYSPRGDIPYLSRVDAGMVERVRATGVEVVTSADLVQLFDATLSDEQLDSHRRSAKRLRDLVDFVFQWVGSELTSGRRLTERTILDLVEERIAQAGLVRDHPAIVAVNEHAADPHFEVPARDASPVRVGDLLLFDVWARESAPGSIYADITWCAFCGGEPPEEMQRVFRVVRDARDAVTRRADEAFRNGGTLKGYELDQVARGVIRDAGYGEYFIHRTGHSLHEEVHGNGANLDDLETHDTRQLLPRSLFTVEPGVYLPGRFGIRSEVDVYHTGSGAEVTGSPHQTELVRIAV